MLFECTDSKGFIFSLWVTRLDYIALSVPMTYEGKSGKQYVAVTAAGGDGITDPNPANSEALYVFALP